MIIHYGEWRHDCDGIDVSAVDVSQFASVESWAIEGDLA